MVGAGVEVGGDRRRRLLDRAHPDDAAGQPFRTAGHEVGLVEPLPQPGVAVVRQARVDLQVLMGAAELFVIVDRGAPGLPGDHDGLLGDHPLVRAENLPGDRGLAGVHQVRVSTVGVGAGQLDHLGPQRRQQSGGPPGARFDHLRQRGHPVEIVAHGGQGFGVGSTEHVLDQRTVAHPEPEDEPARMKRRQGAPAALHRARDPGVDIGDAGAHHQTAGGGQERRRLHQAVLESDLGDEQRAVPEFLDLLRHLRGSLHRPGVTGPPDTDSGGKVDPGTLGTDFSHARLLCDRRGRDHPSAWPSGRAAPTAGSAPLTPLADCRHGQLRQLRPLHRLSHRR